MEWAWHVHHKTLIELLTEPIENRIDYIKREKAPDEVELRLRLLKKVKGPLSDKFSKARAELSKARAEHNAELEALHKVECPNCPWDGRTILYRSGIGGAKR